MRLRFLAAGALLVANALPMAAKADGDFMSVESLVPGCRDIIEDGRGTSEFVQGLCAGEVSATWSLLQDLNLVCGPAGASANDALIVVLSYTLSRPDRRGTRFATLVVEALRTAWPCPQSNG